MSIDTTDPRANYPPDQRFVNQGTDRRMPGALGKHLALIQRLNSFKSTEPPTRRVKQLHGGGLREIATGPDDAWHLSLAFPYDNGKRWATFRLGHRYDGQWGDGKVKGFNPQPEIVGGYILDLIVKLRAREPFIDTD
jgi:hypothetical protein